MKTQNTTATVATKGNATKGQEKEKPRRIGEVAIEALKAGKSAQEALDAVKAEFPNSNTKMASIYWYASKQGIDLQGRRNNTPREDKTQATKAPAKRAEAAPKTGKAARVKEPARTTGRKVA